MENREDLGNSTRESTINILSEHVLRVLGQNPGKFTLQGTNTYVIGSQNPYILIDTAEGLPSYIPVLSAALEGARSNSTKQDVSDIIISHWHRDHVGGLPSVLTLLKDLWEARNPGTPYSPPRLHKYPLPDGTKGEHNSPYNLLPQLLEQLPKDLYVPASDGVFHDLLDNQVFSDQASGLALFRVLHTPGHTLDSICLHIPQDRALYTADTVLGHGTAVFEDLAIYLATLNRMLHFGSSSLSPPPPENISAEAAAKEEIDLEYVTLYPAHGAIVADGKEAIKTYIKHRLEREAQILQVLQSPIPHDFLGDSNASSTAWTTWNLVRSIYKTYPESLWLPAARSVDLHLRKLEGEGLIERIGGEGNNTQWKFLILSPSFASL